MSRRAIESSYISRMRAIPEYKVRVDFSKSCNKPDELNKLIKKGCTLLERGSPNMAPLLKSIRHILLLDVHELNSFVSEFIKAHMPAYNKTQKRGGSVHAVFYPKPGFLSIYGVTQIQTRIKNSLKTINKVRRKVLLDKEGRRAVMERQDPSYSVDEKKREIIYYFTDLSGIRVVFNHPEGPEKMLSWMEAHQDMTVLSYDRVYNTHTGYTSIHAEVEWKSKVREVQLTMKRVYEKSLMDGYHRLKDQDLEKYFAIQ
ncbi:MAG: hypothetical protein ACMUJM_05025 [bacterium]